MISNCVQAQPAPTSAGRKGPPPCPQPCAPPMRSDRRRAPLRALDLFCGAGGATKGLQRAGFHVTGVDIKPQKNYCGDWFVQADATDPPLELGSFDFIWASPPCQAFVQGLNNFDNDPVERVNLIPQTRAMLERSGVPYAIENVPRAPLRPDLKLNGWMFPDLKVIRERWFECSFPVLQPFGGRPRDLLARGYLSVAGGGTQKYCTDRGYPRATVDNVSAAMGIDWMTRLEMSQAIPPAYSEFIARAFLAQIKNKNDFGGPLTSCERTQGLEHEGRHNGLFNGRSRGTMDARADDP